MTNDLRILICPTQQKAVSARQVLIDAGFVAASITMEKATTFEYDAETYGGEGGYEAFETRWVVIGRS